jgi:hypothetical protein
MITRKITALAIGAALCVTGATAQAQSSYAQPLGLIVFPANNQSPETQRNDEATCYQWAQQNTGIQNPTTPPAQQQQAKQESGGGGRGALRGAAAGALLSEVGSPHYNNSNEAAWAGAVIGGARGAKEQKVRNQAAQENAQNANNQALQQQLATFNKGFSACMEAKKYTVK